MSCKRSHPYKLWIWGFAAQAVLLSCHPTSEESARQRVSSSDVGEKIGTLRFENDLLALAIPAGGEQVKEVRLIGAGAGEARLSVKDSGGSGLVIEPLPPEGSKGAGLRARARNLPVGIHTGNLLLETGLARPAELLLPYSCKVAGTLEVSPTNPYFNLRAPGDKIRFVEVHGTQAGFVVQRVEIPEGPFEASFERLGAAEENRFRVRIKVMENRLEDEARGFVGRLVIVSNDRNEPRKEVPLFAFGKHNPARAGTDMSSPAR